MLTCQVRSVLRASTKDPWLRGVESLLRSW